MSGTEQRDNARIIDSHLHRGPDEVVVESSLSITVIKPGLDDFPLGVTMRTPGSDRELVCGFLYSEGIIESAQDIGDIQLNQGAALVSLADSSDFQPSEHIRNTTVTSSCGVCGRSSISGLLHMHGPPLSEEIRVDQTHLLKRQSAIESVAKRFSTQDPEVINHLNDKISAVVLQSPNFFGIVEEYEELAKELREQSVLLIVVVAEPLSLGILKPPGERDADIVVGEAQSFGLPVSYGGPYVGFFATREKFVRQMPGRLAGETIDRKGRRSFVLTLSTREQFIRRERATSNICTNQGLCMLAVTIYLAVMGKQGLRELALLNLRKADYLKNKLSKTKGFSIRFNADTFNEIVLKCPRPATEIRDALLEYKILAGLPLGDYYQELADSLLICATELNTVEAIDRLAEKLGTV